MYGIATHAHLRLYNSNFTSLYFPVVISIEAVNDTVSVEEGEVAVFCVELIGVIERPISFTVQTVDFQQDIANNTTAGNNTVRIRLPQICYN